MALLLTLVAAVVVTSAPHLPSPGTLDRFKAALAAGQVDRVTFTARRRRRPLVCGVVGVAADLARDPVVRGRTHLHRRRAGRYGKDELLEDLRTAQAPPSFRRERSWSRST